ncbi:Rpp14/Pop5 family protein [Methanovulcanius yangii]|uniref:Rpp14/Pop5 family protein n=1 Tax=Methanovulcanius yangii TaxID=1789227 RepID=UPI0029C9CAA7|nr:Rpp14/Pop5 family protein [Methanovulcanius yangii]
MVKPRPPTMRTNWRYIAAQIVPASFVPDPREVYYAIIDASTWMWGDVVTSAMQPAVIEAVAGRVIIRCARGHEDALEAALAAVTSVNGSRAAIHPVRTSGTLRALRREVPVPAPEEDGRMVDMKGESYRILSQSGQKVDLVKDGIKKQVSLYVTQEDLEEYNATNAGTDGI